MRNQAAARSRQKQTKRVSHRERALPDPTHEPPAIYQLARRWRIEVHGAPTAGPWPALGRLFRMLADEPLFSHPNANNIREPLRAFLADHPGAYALILDHAEHPKSTWFATNFATVSVARDNKGSLKLSHAAQRRGAPPAFPAGAIVEIPSATSQRLPASGWN